MNNRYFNSIKVRLELNDSADNTQGAILFQFHKGTIRTSFILSLHVDFVHFNSIKVRLEPRKI